MTALLETRDELTAAGVIVRAINSNTHAILALARLISERMPARVVSVRDVVTQEESEAAYRARVGYMMEVEPSDRELVEQALAQAREATPTD